MLTTFALKADKPFTLAVGGETDEVEGLLGMLFFAIAVRVLEFFGGRKD